MLSEIIDLYERNARERGRSLQEKAWLDAFLTTCLRPGSCST